MVCHKLFVRIEFDCTKLPILEWHALFVWPIHVLPPTRKKVAFVFFVVESLSIPGKSMSIVKLSVKIGFEIFPDFEVPSKH